MPSFQSDWSPTTCDRTAPRSGILGSDRHHERGRWKNNRAENSHGSADAAARAQDAAVQEPGFSPEISFHARRRLQHFQRSAPSHFSPNAPRPSRCGDDHVADRARSSLKFLSCRRFTLAALQCDNPVTPATNDDSRIQPGLTRPERAQLRKGFRRNPAPLCGGAEGSAGASHSCRRDRNGSRWSLVLSHGVVKVTAVRQLVGHTPSFK